MKQRPGLYIVFKDSQGLKVSLKEKKRTNLFQYKYLKISQPSWKVDKESGFWKRNKSTKGLSVLYSKSSVKIKPEFNYLACKV